MHFSCQLQLIEFIDAQKLHLTDFALISLMISFKRSDNADLSERQEMLYFDTTC